MKYNLSYLIIIYKTLKLRHIAITFFVSIFLVLSWPNKELSAGASYLRRPELAKHIKNMKNIYRVRSFGNETITYEAWSDYYNLPIVVLNQNGYLPMFLFRNDQNKKKESLFGVFSSLFTEYHNKALILGLGVGMTTFAASHLYKSVKVFEINPTTTKIVKRFASKNEHLLERDNVEIIMQDGFIGTYLEPNESYDAIISTLSSMVHHSASKMYSKDFLEIAKKKLTKNGVFSIWYDSRYPVSDIDILYDTLLSVFNECNTFLLDPYYHFLICGKKLKQKSHKDINTKNEFIKELLSHAPYLKVDAQKYFGRKKHNNKLNTLNKLMTSYKIYKESHDYELFLKLIREKLRDLTSDPLKICKSISFLERYEDCECILDSSHCCPKDMVYCINANYEGECRFSCTEDYIYKFHLLD